MQVSLANDFFFVYVLHFSFNIEDSYFIIGIPIKFSKEYAKLHSLCFRSQGGLMAFVFSNGQSENPPL